MFDIDAAQIREVGARYGRAAEALPETVRAQFATLSPQVEETGVALMRGATDAYPFGHSTGRLATSTAATTELDGLTLTTLIEQPARSLPNQDGTGGGFPYATSVWKGRGAVLVDRMWSSHGLPGFGTGKRALWGPHFGPRLFAQASTPQDYPATAVPGTSRAVTALASKWGVAVLRSALE